MNSLNKSKVYYYLGLFAAFFFALTAWMWTFFINLFIALPFGLLALLFWYLGKGIETEERSSFKYIIYILGFGVLVSLIILIVLLLNN